MQSRAVARQRRAELGTHECSYFFQARQRGNKLKFLS